MLETQQAIKGLYNAVNHVNTGGMSHIYEVEGPWDTPAVLKIAKQPTTLMNAQIDNEAKVLAAIHHERIPTLLDKVTLNQHYHGIVMQQMEGRRLVDVVETDKRTFNWREVLDIARQLAAIIQAFHNSQVPVVIRDIKPSNILLAKHNQVYLIDFGASVFLNSPEKARALGTIGYAAPEQFENAVVDLRSDLFSFGATLFYLISHGENIYTSSYKTIMSERLPASFTNLILKMTETNVTKRYDTIDQVIKKLSKVRYSFLDRVFRGKQKSS